MKCVLSPESFMEKILVSNLKILKLYRAAVAQIVKYISHRLGLKCPLLKFLKSPQKSLILITFTCISTEVGHNFITTL